MWRLPPLTSLGLSASFAELLRFVGKLGVFLIYDHLKFCTGGIEPKKKAFSSHFHVSLNTSGLFLLPRAGRPLTFVPGAAC